MKTTKNYTSSRKSPCGPYNTFTKNPVSIYQNMFFEDFFLSFSIDLAKSKYKDDFYNITPKGSELKNLLCFQNYHFLRYDLDKIFSQIMYTLVFSGKTYVEIVLSTDEENSIVGISLVPFHPFLSIRCFKNTYFAALLKNKKIKLFKIEKMKVVSFKLSDLDCTRCYFRRVYRKLNHLDMVKVSKMTMSPGKTGFDFTAWNDKSEYKLLNITKKIGWYGRASGNKYMGDAYLLYRSAKFKLFRKKFLDYFLEKINQALQPICRELNIQGSLVANTIDLDLEKLFQKLSDADLNFDQLSDIIWKNKIY